jgi:hypothetical protein
MESALSTEVREVMSTPPRVVRDETPSRKPRKSCSTRGPAACRWWMPTVGWSASSRSLI